MSLLRNKSIGTFQDAIALLGEPAWEAIVWARHGRSGLEVILHSSS